MPKNLATPRMFPFAEEFNMNIFGRQSHRLVLLDGPSRSGLFVHHYQRPLTSTGAVSLFMSGRRGPTKLYHRKFSPAVNTRLSPQAAYFKERPNVGFVGGIPIQWLPTRKALARQYATEAAKDQGLKTPLYDLHIAHGGKMVPFGGYSMPVQYKDLSIGESHLWTREKASLFDVSHMLQHEMSGPGAQKFLETITPASLASIPSHGSTLSCFLHPEGGIVDDCIITKLSHDSFYFVTNAGCRSKDIDFIEENLKKWTDQGNDNVEWKTLQNGLVALQGPLAAKLLEPLVADLADVDLKTIHFGQSRYIKFRLPSGKETTACLVSRGGYTGEDGFEISVPEEETVPFVEFLLRTAGKESLRFAGLGARDSLRLEAGMCLYGHDLDDSTTPVEAGLSWIIGKDRRETGGFNGSDTILPQLTPASKGGSGVKRRRVGLIVEGAPAREGAEIVDPNGNVIGTVTSGCPSPTLSKNIAMGYVETGHHKSGTELAVKVRGKQRKATVTKMPFVPPKYYKGSTT